MYVHIRFLHKFRAFEKKIELSSFQNEDVSHFQSWYSVKYCFEKIENKVQIEKNTYPIGS